MSNDEVREIIASLREGDEVEVVYRGKVRRSTGSSAFVLSGAMEQWHADRAVSDVRVIKRAPLPEPPVGTPVWWNGRWWAVDPMWDDTPNDGDRWYVSLGENLADSRRARWTDMPGAKPAVTPDE